MMTKFLSFVIILLAIGSFLAGCGGAGVDRDNRPPVPAAASLDEFRPNYLGDVIAYYWPQNKITYRIVTAHATDIRLDAKNQPIPLPFLTPNPSQAEAIRRGVMAWQPALVGLRTIEQVAGDDTTANVDIVLREERDMPAAMAGDDQGNGGEVSGTTHPWRINGSQNPELGRVVIHVRGDLNDGELEETARHEAGHGIVGFWGHSRHVGDVMYPRKLWFKRVKGLSTYDENSARANYIGR